MANMYRYLEKYIGTYRVKAEYDTETEDFPRNEDGTIDESFEDLYIPCAKGRILSTYTPDTLVWYTDSIGQGRNLAREIDAKYKGKVTYTMEETDGDVMIYFNEDDLKKIATLVTPRTSGASIKPFSDKNLPHPPYTIPSEDYAKLSDIIKDLDAVGKMQFTRKVISDFDEVIKEHNKRKKTFNPDEERKKSRLKPKEYIHKCGMWEEFIAFAKEAYGRQ